LPDVSERGDAVESQYLSLFAELGAILGSSESREARSAAILSALRPLVPYAAASISAMPTGSVDHVSLANDGYPEHVERHLNEGFVHRDPAFLLMRRSAESGPLRWRDVQGDYREMFSAREVFMPAGFDEGVTVCMRNRRGYYTGSMHLSVDDRRHPTDEAMRVLRHLRVMLGELTDLGAPPPPAPATAAAERVTIAPTGRPGANLVPHVSDSLVRQVRVLAAANRLPPWFWWRSGRGDVRLVTTERVGDEITVGTAAAAVPYGLSVRELEVLTLLAGGLTNAQIGRRLGISPKTVAKHVEHTLNKLGAASRTEAAVRATRVGLLLLAADAAA
jgi:DNA-binding CsgD family transcriptional regulator